MYRNIGYFSMICNNAYISIFIETRMKYERSFNTIDYPQDIHLNYSDAS